MTSRRLVRTVGRALLAVVGILGGLLCFDAILLIALLLLLTVLGGGAPNPYLGLLVILVLPPVALAGGALAWVAYLVLRAPEESHDAAPASFV